MNYTRRLKRIIDKLQAATHDDSSKRGGGDVPAQKSSEDQMFTHMYGSYGDE